MSLPSLNRFFEPEFYYFRNEYWSESCPNVDKMERHLLARILENPMDLDSHVRRILLNIHFQRSEHLIGALQDFFIVLGEKGEPIKRNVLKRSELILPAEVLAPFNEGLMKNVDFSPVKNSYSYLY